MSPDRLDRCRHVLLDLHLATLAAAIVATLLGPNDLGFALAMLALLWWPTDWEVPHGR